MDIVELQPDDALVTAFVDVTNAMNHVDAPWSIDDTVTRRRNMLRHGWDGEPGQAFVGTIDDTVVCLGQYDTSEWDNTHLAWLEVGTHPDHRGRGYGSEMLEHLMERARGEGRTSVGMDGWDGERALRFAKRHGFERKSQAINRRMAVADLSEADVRAMHEEAVAAASDYELQRLFGPSPSSMLDSLAEMTSAINDAPLDALEIEDEVFTGERIRRYEEAQQLSGNRIYRVLARHRGTGQLAGHSVVAVESERPQIGHQHDTSVVRAHRGHRLGLLLKAEMVLWLREAEPALETIDTWNAESNDHMIAVNEQLRYRVLGRGLQFQRSL